MTDSCTAEHCSQTGLAMVWRWHSPERCPLRADDDIKPVIVVSQETFDRLTSDEPGEPSEALRAAVQRERRFEWVDESHDQPTT